MTQPVDPIAGSVRELELKDTGGADTSKGPVSGIEVESDTLMGEKKRAGCKRFCERCHLCKGTVPGLTHGQSMNVELKA